MVNKNNNKTRPRVIVNTLLLLAMTIIFGCLTFCATSRVQNTYHNFSSISDAPALCYDETILEDGSIIRENSYLCSTEYDASTDKNVALEGSTESALFLFDRMTLASLMQSTNLSTIIATVGSLFTIAGLVGTVVYFNHNRK